MIKGGRKGGLKGGGKPPSTESEPEPEPEPSLQKTHTARATEPDGFALAWSIYPRRAGGNPRLAALRAYQARIAEGISEADLAAGVARYAAYCAAEGDMISTRFVQQGATFFGPKRYWAEPWEPSKNGGRPQGQQARNFAAIEQARAEMEAEDGNG